MATRSTRTSRSLWRRRASPRPAAATVYHHVAPLAAAHAARVASPCDSRRPSRPRQAPWYLNAEGPGLKHQKNLKQKGQVASATDFKPRGQKAGPAATYFRKGACTNCGAMTHSTKVDTSETPPRHLRDTSESADAS